MKDIQLWFGSLLVFVLLVACIKQSEQLTGNAELPQQIFMPRSMVIDTPPRWGEGYVGDKRDCYDTSYVGSRVIIKKRDCPDDTLSSVPVGPPNPTDSILYAIGNLVADWDGRFMAEGDLDVGSVVRWTSKEGIPFEPLEGYVSYQDSMLHLDSARLLSPDTRLFNHAYFTLALVLRLEELPTQKVEILKQGANFNQHFNLAITAEGEVEAKHSTNGLQLNRTLHHGSGEKLVLNDSLVYIILRVASGAEELISSQGGKKVLPGGYPSFTDSTQAIELGTSAHAFKVARILYFAGDLGNQEASTLQAFLDWQYFGGAMPEPPLPPVAESEAHIYLLSQGDSLAYDKLDAAVEAAQAGDTLALSEGTLRLSSPFSLEKPGLILKGAGRGKTIIKGMNQAYGWKPKGEIYAAPYTGSVGLHLVSAVNDTPLVRVAQLSELQDRAGTFFYDGDSLFIRLHQDKDPTGIMVDVPAFSPVLEIKASNTTLMDVDVYGGNGYSYGSQGTSIALDSASHNDTLIRVGALYADYKSFGGNRNFNSYFQDCYFAWGGKVGFDIKNTDPLDPLFTFYDQAPAQNIHVTACTLAFNNFRYLIDGETEFHNGGAKNIPSSRGHLWEYCHFAHNWGPGLWFDYPRGEITIRYNTFVDNHMDIFYEISQSGETPNSPRPEDILYQARIYGNVGVGFRAIGLYISASKDVRALYNSFSGHGWPLVCHGLPRGNFTLENVVVMHNIVDADIDRSPLLIVRTGENSSGHIVDRNFYRKPEGRDFCGGCGDYYPIGHPDGGGFGATAATLADAIRDAQANSDIIIGHFNAVADTLSFADQWLRLPTVHPYAHFGAYGVDTVSVPGTPSLLQVHASSDSTEMTVSWGAASALDKHGEDTFDQYVVEILSPERKTIWTRNTSYTLEGLSAGQRYHLRISAENYLGKRGMPVEVRGEAGETISEEPEQE